MLTVRSRGAGGAPDGQIGAIPLLFLVTNFDRGGAEKAVVSCAKGLRDGRYRVGVAALQRKSGAIASDLACLGTPAYDLGMASKYDPRVLVRLWRLIRRDRIRILVSYLFHPTFLGRLVGAAAGVPIRLSAERAMSWDSLPRRLLNRWTAPLATHVMAVSDRVAAYAAREYQIPESRLSVIPNGVDLTHFQPRRAGTGGGTALTLGCTGRLHKKNDHLTLLQAFARVRARWPEVRLVLLGRGPEEARIRTAVAALGLASCTQFVGEQADVAPWLAQMDLYVQTSIAEGMPNSVLEAMATALPVVATAVGGTPEVVEHERTGLLVPPRDPAAAAAAVESLLESAVLREAFGRAGRRRVEERFGDGLMVKRMVQLLDHLVAGQLGLRYEEPGGWMRPSSCASR